MWIINQQVIHILPTVITGCLLIQVVYIEPVQNNEQPIKLKKVGQMKEKMKRNGSKKVNCKNLYTSLSYLKESLLRGIALTIPLLIAINSLLINDVNLMINISVGIFL